MREDFDSLGLMQQLGMELRPKEFWEENAKAWSAWGKEAAKVKGKMMKYVTKQEQKMAWYQKELSYTPAKKEK